MKKYDYYYNTNKSKTYTKYVLVGLFTIFCLIITTFALLEVHNFYSDEPAVVRILMNSFKSSKAEEIPDSSNNKFVLVNLEEQEQLEHKEELLKHILTQEQLNSERQARAATNENSTNSSPPKSNTYYEEQTPVVVYSKTDTNPSIAYRQMAEVPPRQDKDQEEDPYSKPLADEDYEGSDDYFGQPEQRTPQEPQPYYRQQPPQPSYYRQQDQQQPPQAYYRQQPPPPPPPPQPYYTQQPPQSPYYQSPPNSRYYNAPDNDQQDSEEARSSQYRDYQNYYRQYPYATPPPMPANNKRLPDEDNQGNRKMSTALAAKGQQQNRDPYPSYMDDYDYMSPQSHAPPAPQYPYAKRPVPPQIPQYRTPSTAAPAEEKQETAPQMDYLSILKSLKTMWDLYQSFTSSWNTIAERRNREEQMAQQKYKQMQQIRINSKKPPKFNNNKKNNTQTTKNPRKQTTTTSTVAPILNSSEMYTSSEEESSVQQVKKQPLAKVEPRRGMKVNSKNEDNLRDKRQADSTDVGEGRYIKGDPLKGYYDFVITEGSYKFWAAFQVGTAILIIYSTFAAIYYSKVNPLVSDYDYTDYLGGARSLSGGDLDFVDDDAGAEQKAQPKSWLEYLPRSGHSLKFILDAIDKLPTDHVGDEGVNKDVEAEEGNREARDSSYESEYTDEGGSVVGGENTDESDTSSETKQDNNAM